MSLKTLATRHLGAVHSVRETSYDGEVGELRPATCSETDWALTDAYATIDLRDRQIESMRRLMALSLRITFRMGPALEELLKNHFGDPSLTADGTAVAFEGLNAVVVFRPFQTQNQVVLHAVTGPVPDREFTLTLDGRLTDDDQTLMIGHFGRIQAAAETNIDPVSGDLALTGASTVQ